MTTSTKYTRTKSAVEAYDRAWDVALAAATGYEANAAITAVDDAEELVRSAWADEAALHADETTAANVRDLGLPRCPADWRFLRGVVLA